MKRWSFLVCFASAFVIGGCTMSAPTSVPMKHTVTDHQHATHDALDDRFAKTVADLPTGSLQYNTPPSMRLGHAQRIKATILRTMTTAIAKSMGGAPGTVVTTNVTVSDDMRAELFGDPALLAIVPLQDDSELQTFGPDGTMMWQWDVTPKAVQPADLQLIIEVAVTVPGSAERRFSTVKEVVIPVQWDFGYWLQDFFATNWQWLVSTAVIPIGIWLVRKRQTRRLPVKKSDTA